MPATIISYMVYQTITVPWTGDTIRHTVGKSEQGKAFNILHVP